MTTEEVKQVFEAIQLVCDRTSDLINNFPNTWSEDQEMWLNQMWHYGIKVYWTFVKDHGIKLTPDL